MMERIAMTTDNVPDKIEYGFMYGDQLLHLQLVEVDRHPTRKTVHELAPIERCDNTLGEWTTTELMTVLSMRLMPADWCDMTEKGDSSEHPRPTYGEAHPVAIHTKRFPNGTLQKLYIPLLIPEEVDRSHLEHRVIGIKNSYSVYVYGGGSMVVGNYYYWVWDKMQVDTQAGSYIEKGMTVCECITPIGDEYLLLAHAEDVLATKLLRTNSND